MKIAVILARSGSKRIKNKNIKLFYKKPIIFYTLEKILNSSFFHRVIVSTDSDKIIKLCQKNFHIDFHKRKKKYSNDKATTIDAVRSCIKDKKIKKLDNVCCIYPCTPFLKKIDIIKSYKKLLKSRNKFITPVKSFDHPIERAMKIHANKLIPIKKKIINLKGQSCGNFFHDVGQFYWAKAFTWLNSRSGILSNSIPYEVSGIEYLDINTLNDWKKAQQIYKIYK